MELNEILLELNNREHEIKNLSRRIDEIDKKQSSINELTTSVSELAINMKYMVQELKDQGNRLDRLEREPIENARHYKREAITTLITALSSAAVGAVITMIVNTLA